MRTQPPERTGAPEPAKPQLSPEPTAPPPSRHIDCAELSADLTEQSGHSSRDRLAHDPDAPERRARPRRR